MNITGTKPVRKGSLKEYLFFIGIFLLISIAIAQNRSNIEDEAIREYLDDNYESIYEDAYNEGYNQALSDIESSEDDNLISICYKCYAEYDPTSVFNFGHGLCDGCGRSSLDQCVFCGNSALEWGETGYTVCPDCAGDVVELTDIESFLEDFNEIR